jgi:hypothetical protein
MDLVSRRVVGRSWAGCIYEGDAGVGGPPLGTLPSAEVPLMSKTKDNIKQRLEPK